MHVRIRRALATTAAGVLLAAGSVGTAYADDVSNDLDTTVDAVAEVMAVNVGGGDASTLLYIRATGTGNRPEDGKAGCNLTGTTTLGISISSSNTGVATVSPSTATFTSCNDTKQLTVHGVATGTAVVTIAQTSNTSGGTFNLAPATFTVNVAAPAPANTAPAIAVDGVTEGASYAKGSVPSATCEVTDAEDGARSLPAVLTGTLDDDGLGEQTAACTYTDAGGSTVSASKSFSIIDPSAPEIGYTLSPATPDGDDGWYRGDVTLTWHVTESESPSSLVATGCVDQTVSADQLDTPYSCSASSSGGSSGPVTVDVKRDGNGPDVGYTSATGELGDAGWYTSPVTATFSATDAFSGVAGSETRSVESTTDGTAVVLDSPAFTDRAGNTTPAGDAKSPAFSIDTVAPSVGDALLSGTLGKDGWYTTAVTASFTATDGTSGVVGDTSRTVSTGTDQGEVTLESPAFRDVAGNVTDAGARSATVKVDSVVPTVELVDGPAHESAHYFGAVPAPPSCTASDWTSGVDGECTVTGYSTAVGTHTVTATVADRAGNIGTSTHTYTVKAWTMNGYHRPVDMGGVWNTVKNGSTVPLKFEVFAGTAELTSTGVIGATFTVRPVTCNNATADDIELTTTGGTSLRYDTTGGQFIQNWQTPKKPGACYTVSTTTVDGTSITANFLLK